MKQPKWPTIHIRVPKEMRAILKKVAKKLGVPVAEVVRMAILDFSLVKDA